MKRVLTAALLAASIGLGGCVPLVVAGGVAVGAWLGSDPRPATTMKDDQELSVTLVNRFYNDWKDKAHVNVSVFNGMVLITGEVPDAASKAKITEVAKSYPATRRLFDETVIAPPSSAVDRLNDSQLTARVKSVIVAKGGDASNVHLQVITERNVVYLLGAAPAATTDLAAQLAATVSGVSQVVKVVEPWPTLGK